jgi:hypothetical protein
VADAFESGKHCGSIALFNNGTAWAFQFGNCSVTIEANNQYITLLRSFL